MEESGISKRGQKPDENIFKTQVDHLEILAINHKLECLFENEIELSKAQKKERNRRRNEISALDSRIKTKREELFKAHEAEIMIEKFGQFINAVNKIVGD